MEKHELQKLKDAVDHLGRVTELHSMTLYGTNLNPGGLEKAVRNQTRMMWICTGVFITVQFFRDWWPVIERLQK